MAGNTTKTTLGGALASNETVTSFDKTKLAKIGSYQIEKLSILSPLRRSEGPTDVISLDNPNTTSWAELNFFENIERAVVQGMVTIMDAVGILEGIPILGEEILEVQFSTAGVTPTPISATSSTGEIPSSGPIITNRFRIYKADPPVQVSDTLR